MMKQHSAHPFSLLLLLVTLFTTAQPVKAELFWTYEKDGQQGYLMGSVHFANESFYPLDKKILDAYERSSILVVGTRPPKGPPMCNALVACLKPPPTS